MLGEWSLSVTTSSTTTFVNWTQLVRGESCYFLQQQSDKEYSSSQMRSVSGHRIEAMTKI